MKLLILLALLFAVLPAIVRAGGHEEKECCVTVTSTKCVEKCITKTKTKKELVCVTRVIPGKVIVVKKTKTKFVTPPPKKVTKVVVKKVTKIVPKIVVKIVKVTKVVKLPCPAKKPWLEKRGGKEEKKCRTVHVVVTKTNFRTKVVFVTKKHTTTKFKKGPNKYITKVVCVTVTKKPKTIVVKKTVVKVVKKTVVKVVKKTEVCKKTKYPKNCKLCNEDGKPW